MGDPLVTKRVYGSCPILLSNRLIFVDLVEFDILDFYVILGINWLHACFASMDCRTRVVKFLFPTNRFYNGLGEAKSLEVKLFHV